LKIEPADPAINVTNFAREMETGHDPGFHRIESNFRQWHAAGGRFREGVPAIPNHFEAMVEQCVKQTDPSNLGEGSNAIRGVNTTGE
jgi:hypothetical protein